MHAGIYPPDQTPQTRPPQEQTPLTPPDQTPPGADPPEQTPESRYPPPPGADTPPDSILQHMVNERPVRILLECILVGNELYLNQGVCCFAEILQHFSERQILWSLCLVVFLAFTLRLPIQTSAYSLWRLNPQSVHVQVKNVKISGKRVHS